MEILERILKQNREIIERLSKLENKVQPSIHDKTEIITSTEIIKDLGICNRSFYNMRRKMPFLFKISTGDRWRARRCDYEKWKQSYIPEL